jgi:hypothetical protein
MTTTVSRFEAQAAPCGHLRAGEQVATADLQGLVTEELRYDCGCSRAREEFHDGSVHLMARHHNGRVLMDEELRGE